MARWLLGLKADELSAQKTFRMLNAFIVNQGDLLQQGKLSKAELAWLRLGAGCAMLKICEQKGVGDQFNAEQFYHLSLLMTDEIPQVREIFAAKLHKGLSKGIPNNRCLPLDFMGYYALAGQEQDKRIKAQIRQHMVSDINKRREYIKSLPVWSTGGPTERGMGQLAHILPDYMLVFAVPVLAHDPEFTSNEDVEQLTRVRQCLWFILEPLMTKNEFYCFGFYKNLIERMKNHKDALKGEDDIMNYKLWAVCDLAMGLLLSKTTNYEMKEFPADTRVPTMYFRRHEDALWVNAKSYLPPDMQVHAPKMKPGLPISMVDTSASGMKLVTRGKVRGRTLKQQQGVGINETDVKPSEASDTKIQLPGMEEECGTECDEPPPKRAVLEHQHKLEPM
jgi:sister-chromatid-cohesion protein PDS5